MPDKVLLPFTSEGVSLKTWLASNQSKIKDKDLVYFVKPPQRGKARNTRTTKGLYKIGKQEANKTGGGRLSGYNNIYGDEFGEVKLNYVKIIEKRQSGEAGTKRVRKVESNIHKLLADDKVLGRGNEMFKVSTQRVNNVLSDASVRKPNVAVQVRRRPPTREAKAKAEAQRRATQISKVKNCEKLIAKFKESKK